MVYSSHYSFANRVAYLEADPARHGSLLRAVLLQHSDRCQPAAMAAAMMTASGLCTASLQARPARQPTTVRSGKTALTCLYLR